MRIKILSATALLLTAQFALAQSSVDPLDTRIFKNGLWLGGGVGWTDLESESAGSQISDNSFGYNLGVGYQFLNYFGVSARWRDLGEFTDSVAGQSVTVDVDGYTLGVSAGYPITERIAVNAGLGYFDFDFDDSLAGSGGNEDSGGYFSAGLSSEIGNIVVQPMVVVYDTDLADLWTLELNFYWKLELGN